MISLQILGDIETSSESEQREPGVRSRKWRASVFTIVAPRFSTPEYGEQAQAGMVTYTRETCSKFSHEVLSGRLAPFLSATPDLARHLHPFGGTLGRERGAESLSSLAEPLARALATENVTGKTRGARRGGRILAGVALRLVGGDFPDTEICLRREPPHPREALPTSDIDFPGENRIEVYLRYSTDSGRKRERCGREGSRTLSFSSSPHFYLHCPCTSLFLFFHVAMDVLILSFGKNYYI